MRAPGTGSTGDVEHSALIGALSYGCLLLYFLLQLFALSGMPNDVPRRKRFGAVYRHQPWPAFTALLFLAGAAVCQILYYV
jgi:hypothetical protein